MHMLFIFLSTLVPYTSNDVIDLSVAWVADRSMTSLLWEVLSFPFSLSAQKGPAESGMHPMDTRGSQLLFWMQFGLLEVLPITIVVLRFYCSNT